MILDRAKYREICVAILTHIPCFKSEARISGAGCANFNESKTVCSSDAIIVNLGFRRIVRKRAHLSLPDVLLC